MHPARTSVPELSDATFVRRVRVHDIAHLAIIDRFNVVERAKNGDFVAVMFQSAFSTPNHVTHAQIFNVIYRFKFVHQWRRTGSQNILVPNMLVEMRREDVRIFFPVRAVFRSFSSYGTARKAVGRLALQNYF